MGRNRLLTISSRPYTVAGGERRDFAACPEVFDVSGTPQGAALRARRVARHAESRRPARARRLLTGARGTGAGRSRPLRAERARPAEPEWRPGRRALDA